MRLFNRFTFCKQALLPIVIGLLISHMTAIAFVWRSNALLQESLMALHANGWLTLPAGPAAALLGGFKAAASGALFFTLSIGAGLTLAAWSVCRVLQLLSETRWKISKPAFEMTLLSALIFWAALMVYVNFNGWVFFPSLFVLLTPLVVVLTAVRLKNKGPRRPSQYWPLPLAALLLLTGLWATQFNARMFLTIRDQLLMSNPIGSRVNDFYYRYTLFAAQSFKSFQQKSIRPWRPGSGLDEATTERLARVLARHDVLLTPRLEPVDLIIRPSGGQLMLRSPRHDGLTVTVSDLMREPGAWLERFSRATDRYGPFRRLVFVGLLLGFPILLYVTVDGFIGRLAGRFAGETATLWIRSCTCLVIGALCFLPMAAVPEISIGLDSVGNALDTDDLNTRMAALKYIESQKIDIARYPHYRQLLHSPWDAERYYLARALAYAGNAATFEDLLTLIEDPHPNVVCQAYYALGKRGNRAALEPIRQKMQQSDHWYVQWYGYRAMRRLGWHQSLSK
ncbi:MAG: HEAT repeat domain-containing protein [Desulfatitalea sp.]|nr:HEAT repeat domain-containing protein [Desulfatitalea sp.]NNK00669.1 HEAT repeat domain-containing protein [Desulfatitalea sp.]